jgi:hypothetical protein
MLVCGVGASILESDASSKIPAAVLFSAFTPTFAAVRWLVAATCVAGDEVIGPTLPRGVVA